MDVHAFAPGELARLAGDAGLIDVRVSGEELLANWFGWTNRTLEPIAEPDEVPWAWRQYAYRGYLVLQQLDRRLLESRLPAAHLLQPDARGPQAARRSRLDRAAGAVTAGCARPTGRPPGGRHEPT